MLDALRENGWRIGATAAALGISRTTLYAWMEKSEGIRKARDVGREEIVASLGECDGDVEAAAARLEVSPRGLRLRMKELGVAG
jgi:transcriptional regulator of acetoin/glycerol metabolism